MQCGREEVFDNRYAVTFKARKQTQVPKKLLNVMDEIQDLISRAAFSKHLCCL